MLPAIIRSPATMESQDEILLPSEPWGQKSSNSLQTDSSATNTSTKSFLERHINSISRRMSHLYLPTGSHNAGRKHGPTLRSSSKIYSAIDRKPSFPGNFIEVLELLKGEIDQSARNTPTDYLNKSPTPPPLSVSHRISPCAFMHSDPFDSRPNKPLEPQEYEHLVSAMQKSSKPLDERTIYSLFFDEELKNPDAIRERQRIQALNIIKEKTMGIQLVNIDPHVVVDPDAFRFSDGSMDYFSYFKAISLAYVQNRFSHRLKTRHQMTDEFSTDKFIHSIARLVSLSGPYQHFFLWLRSIALWDNPRTSFFWCVLYFTLVYMRMLGFAIIASPALIIAYHRLRPTKASNSMGFDKLNSGIIDSRLVYVASHSTLGKTKLGQTFWKVWRRELGTSSHILVADTADWMERIRK